MIQQSVFNKARYNLLRRLTSTLIHNLFTNSTKDLVLEDKDVTVGADLRLGGLMSRNTVSLNKEQEPASYNKRFRHIIDQVTTNLHQVYITNAIKLNIGLGNSDQSRVAGETKDKEGSDQVYSKAT